MTGVFVWASAEVCFVGVLGYFGEDVGHASHAFTCRFDIDLWDLRSVVGVMAVCATVLHGVGVWVRGQASSF